MDNVREVINRLKKGVERNRRLVLPIALAALLVLTACGESKMSKAVSYQLKQDLTITIPTTTTLIVNEAELQLLSQAIHNPNVIYQVDISFNDYVEQTTYDVKLTKNGDEKEAQISIKSSSFSNANTATAAILLATSETIRNQGINDPLDKEIIQQKTDFYLDNLTPDESPFKFVQAY